MVLIKPLVRLSSNSDVNCWNSTPGTMKSKGHNFKNSKSKNHKDLRLIQARKRQSILRSIAIFLFKL